MWGSSDQSNLRVDDVRRKEGGKRRAVEEEETQKITAQNLSITKRRASGRVFHQSMISNGFYPKMTFTFWMTAFSRG